MGSQTDDLGSTGVRAGVCVRVCVVCLCVVCLFEPRSAWNCVEVSNEVQSLYAVREEERTSEGT